MRTRPPNPVKISVPMSSTPFAHAAPNRPPMEPAVGVRRVPLRPHEMTGALTATEDLFVLAHLGIPRVDPAQWSLAIDGLVRRPQVFSLDDLKARPKTMVEAMHQCVGNPLEPNVPTRRVANVRWGGVDLAALLDELAIEPQARFLWSYGLDGGDFAGTSCDWYVKDLPLERLAAGGVLLAYELSGAPLPAEHGFPVRLVVPGYYGTNSVKWLWRMHLAERRAEGPFTTVFYNDSRSAVDIAAGLPSLRPVWAIAPESAHRGAGARRGGGGGRAHRNLGMGVVVPRHRRRRSQRRRRRDLHPRRARAATRLALATLLAAVAAERPRRGAAERARPRGRWHRPAIRRARAMRFTRCRSSCGDRR